MKNKRFLFLFFAFLGISFFVLFQKNKFSSIEKRTFSKIPIHFYSFPDRPLIDIEIEGQKYSLLLDLGSSHNIDLHKRVLDKIENKKFIDIPNYINYLGNVYPTPRFLIPEIKLPNEVKINGEIFVYEENINFLADARIWPKIEKTDPAQGKELKCIDGRLGWTIFPAADWFLDFHHSKIFVGKDLSSLIDDAGCSLNGFVEIPFTIEDCGLVISAETDVGEKKFLLDTGATYSFYKETLSVKNSSIEIEPNKWKLSTNKFMFNDKNLGPWNFMILEMGYEKIDGILGVDFFKAHAIFLDFHNKKAYIKAHKTLWGKLVDLLQPNKNSSSLA